MESYEEQVLAYLKDELSEEEQREFEERLADSPELRAMLERSRGVLDLLSAANEKRILRIVHSTIQQAIDRGATAIHHYHGHEEVMVQLRIDGQLQELTRFPKAIHEPVVNRWKIMSDCSLTERQLPQAGHIGIAHRGKEYNLRVTFVPTVHGERVTAGVMAKSRWIELDHLGLSTSQVETVRRLIRSPAGLIPLAGPVAGGKTTLLYAMLLELRASSPDARNLMTVEDPVAYAFEGISQTSVSPQAGLTCAAALRAISQSDPDVVLVDPLRDRESAELALEMAVAGRLMLATLVASSALAVVQNLRAMGVEPFLLAQALAGVVGQRLVRRVCPECVREYLPSSAALETIGFSPDEDGPFRRGAGCEACRQTGYAGRIGLFEVLEVDDTLRRLIADGAPMETLRRETLGRAGGSLWDDGREKVRQGLTTVEEVTRVLFDYPQPALEPRGLSIRR